jgi:hypothetical protein
MNSVTEVERSVPVGRPDSFGGLMICAHHTTQAIPISAVSLLPGSKDLVVADFGTRPNPFLQKNKEALGVHRGLTSRLGFHSTSVAACLPPRQGTGGDLTAPTELAVTLRSTAAVGETPGLLVSYIVAGRSHSVALPFAVTLCTAAATRARTAACVS